MLWWTDSDMIAFGAMWKINPIRAQPDILDIIDLCEGLGFLYFILSLIGSGDTFFWEQALRSSFISRRGLKWLNQT